MRISNSKMCTGKKLAVFLSSGLLALAWSIEARAADDDLPPGFTPPAVVPDQNGVDLISGQFRFPLPSLQIAADPRLDFSHIDDYNIRVNGTRKLDPDTGIALNLHFKIGSGTSESFQCFKGLGGGDDGCFSSSPNPSFMKGGLAPMLYQSGSGRIIDFKQVYSTVPDMAKCTPGTSQGTICNVTSMGTSLSTIVFASSISYPDGETHQIFYDVVTLQSTIGTFTYSLPRPAKIVSNRGFEMRFTYLFPVSTYGTDLRL
jgi:hypothetical protein